MEVTINLPDESEYVGGWGFGTQKFKLDRGGEVKYSALFIKQYRRPNFIQRALAPLFGIQWFNL